MAGFELDPIDPPALQPETPAGDAAPDSAPQLTAAVQRFQSCRWREKAEDGVPDHCTHRDVQPMAGTCGFAPDAWCPDCGLYKVRRNPRKHAPQMPENRIYY